MAKCKLPFCTEKVVSTGMMRRREYCSDKHRIIGWAIKEANKLIQKNKYKGPIVLFGGSK